MGLHTLATILIYNLESEFESLFSKKLDGCRDLVCQRNSTQFQRSTSSQNEIPEPRKLDTYGSERSWEPVESVTTIRGDCKVKTEACTDNARSRTGNTDNMTTGRKEHWQSTCYSTVRGTSVGATLYLLRL